MTSSWDVMDPTATYGPPSVAPSSPATQGSVGSADVGANFWNPGHPMFGFGVLVFGTAVVLFLATEDHGIGASARAHFGPAHAGAEAGLGEGS